MLPKTKGSLQLQVSESLLFCIICFSLLISEKNNSSTLINNYNSKTCLKADIFQQHDNRERLEVGGVADETPA